MHGSRRSCHYAHAWSAVRELWRCCGWLPPARPRSSNFLLDPSSQGPGHGCGLVVRDATTKNLRHSYLPAEYGPARSRRLRAPPPSGAPPRQSNEPRRVRHAPAPLPAQLPPQTAPTPAPPSAAGEQPPVPVEAARLPGTGHPHGPFPPSAAACSLPGSSPRSSCAARPCSPLAAAAGRLGRGDAAEDEPAGAGRVFRSAGPGKPGPLQVAHRAAAAASRHGAHPATAAAAACLLSSLRCGVQVANPAFASLLSHVTHFLEAKSRVATRAKLGAEWVRGWGDSGEPGADAAAARRLPSSGNQQ